MSGSTIRRELNIVARKPEYLRGDNWNVYIANGMNVLIGKNGMGKSDLLRAIATGEKEKYPVHLVNPERGGVLNADANLRNEMDTNAQSDSDARSAGNQVANSKQRSATKWGRLGGIVLERARSASSDRAKIRAINEMSRIEGTLDSLLPNVSVRSTGGQKLQFISRNTNEPIPPGRLSSGESEAISLAIECIEFVYANQDTESKHLLLLLDEPDAHMHPDLQRQFLQFLQTLTKKHRRLRVVIATHSLPLLASSLGVEDVGVHWLTDSDEDIHFSESKTATNNFIAEAGNHPISIALQDKPIVLVEGEDDAAVWRRAARCSKGRIKVYPIACGGKAQVKSYEGAVRTILTSISDDNKGPTIFSVYDRDDSVSTNLQDTRFVQRFKLRCSEIENCFLSDEVLGACGTSWPILRKKIDLWLANNKKDHKAYPVLHGLVHDSANTTRMRADLKPAMNVLRGLVSASNPPWQDKIGEAFGKLNTSKMEYTRNGLVNFLGKELVNAIWI